MIRYAEQQEKNQVEMNGHEWRARTSKIFIKSQSRAFHQSSCHIGLDAAEHHHALCVIVPKGEFAFVLEWRHKC